MRTAIRLETRRGLRWRSWLASCLAFAAVVAAAEGGARLVAPAMPDAPGWNVPRMARHAEAVEALAAQHGGVDLLAFGSSVVEAGIDEDALVAADDRFRTGYTLWLPGAPARSLEVLWRDLARPALQPDTVVLGLTSRELNDGGDGQYRQFTALVTSRELHRLAGRETPAQRLDRVLSEYSAFLRLRGRLRDPGRLLRALRGGDGGDEAGDDEVQGPGDDEVFRNERSFVEQELRALSGFTVGGEELAALGRLIGEIRASGAELLVVNVPVEDTYVDWHPNGTADVERYERALEGLLDEEGVAYLNAHRELDWGREHFTNANHLNAEGRARLTTAVAEELDRLQRP